MSYSFDYWISNLNLTKHVEGGAFREIYRSGLSLPQKALTGKHNGDRSAMTSIFYLLQYGDFSAFHRIASDELWHFYDGFPLHIYEITEEGALIHHLLGKNFEKGCSLFISIKAGSWFASRVENENGYALCGCTVAPGFDFRDFELAERNLLNEKFPVFSKIINELTR